MGIPRVIFLGTGLSMQKLLREITKISGLEFVALYTTLGQSQKIEKQAHELHLHLEELKNLELPSGEKKLQQYRPDWIFSVLTPVILSPSILSIPTHGCINMHPGKLPEYAGNDVYQWAIRNGEKKFGVTLHWMTPQVDAGPIIYFKEFDISEKDTGLSLFIKCADSGTELISKALTEISQGKPLPKIEQDLRRRKIYLHRESLDGKISWKLTARQIVDFVRAGDYAPFKSPTYSPFICLKGKQIVVKKAKIAHLKGGIPGEVISINEQGIIVAAIDGTSVIFTAVELQGKGRFCGSAIASSLKIKNGDRF
ncbi:MAG: formyltransferase family protein [Candidatus Omnitrophica bacterium]|nr:formyltransferase family protein [Candidatus Omnitrophota bacterium]